jgi:phosphoribosylanthranilate isomerase
LDNIAEALEISGAQAIDISSGVEDRPGVKNLEKIGAFLDAVRGLNCS